MKPESIHWALAYAKTGFRAFPVYAIRAGLCSSGGSKSCAPGKRRREILNSREQALTNHTLVESGQD
jgi:hypothetical protein